MTRLTDDELFRRVCARQHSTGLRNNIWIGPRGGAPYAARIEVRIDHRPEFDVEHLAVVSVEDDPPQLLEGDLDAGDLALVRRYVALNRQVIVDHWEERTDALQLVRGLERLT
jgi:hypothetical protein